MYKDNVGGLESYLIDKIQGEQMEKFKRQANEIELKNDKFKTYKQAILNMINADWAKNAEYIKEQLKTKADHAKITDPAQKPNKRGPDYPG